MKMKTINKFLVLLIIASALSSCIEEFGGTGEAFNRQEQVVGTWTVTTMVQRDLLTDNPLIATYDITDIYAFEQYSLVLNADGTFSTSNPGQAPQFTASSGTWALDDEARPSAILLTSGSSSSKLDFTSLNSLTERNDLEVAFTRNLIFEKIVDGQIKEEIKQALSYEYTLSKSN